MKSAGDLCPLSNPDLGIVSEQDHFTNQCICHLCTCSTHVCPNKRTSGIPKSSYFSHYKLEFARHCTPAPPKRTTALTYRATPNKIDAKTTSKEAFQGHQPISASTHARPQSSVTSGKFMGRSQYSSDFPNWGPNYVIHNKRPVQPVHVTNLHMPAKSSYAEQFYPRPSSRSEQRPGMKRQTSSCTMPTGPGMYETTSQREFRRKSTASVAQVKVKAPLFVPLKYSASQFKSINKATYQAAMRQVIDPHLLRKRVK